MTYKQQPASGNLPLPFVIPTPETDALTCAFGTPLRDCLYADEPCEGCRTFEGEWPTKTKKGKS